MAGILAVVTEAGRNQGQPAMGFVNPLIYELARAGSDALRDVTVVSNDVNAVGCDEATEGFATASGWGSVNAAGLLAALANPNAAVSATGLVPWSSTVTLDASGSVVPVTFTEPAHGSAPKPAPGPVPKPVPVVPRFTR